MAKRNYDFDYRTMTLTTTKSFEEAMKDPFSKEYKIFRQLRKDYPMLNVVSKKTSHAGKGLTYDNMRDYILCYANSDEILPMFHKAIELSVAQPSRYAYVKKWFLTQFPNYREVPDLSDAELYVMPFAPKAEETAEEKKEGAVG